MNKRERELMIVNSWLKGIYKSHIHQKLDYEKAMRNINFVSAYPTSKTTVVSKILPQYLFIYFILFYFIESLLQAIVLENLCPQKTKQVDLLIYFCF